MRLVSDDSGHRYAIPAGERANFDAWVASFEDDVDSGYKGPDFEQYRLDMHIANYTFTDLQEDKD